MGCHVKPEQFFNLIFGLESVVGKADQYTLAGGLTVALSSIVPTGKMWVITGVAVRSWARAITDIYGGPFHDGTFLHVLSKLTSTPQWAYAPFVCEIYLDEGDQVWFTLGGGQNGDVIDIHYSGYQMAVA